MSLLLGIANAVSALVLGPFVLPYSLATHTEPQLCALMKGTYNEKAVGDKCPDGQWAALVPLVREAVPQPKGK